MSPKIIRLDGVIGQGEGEVSAQSVREQLPPNGTDPIAVKIHSEGGSVFEGFAIHDLFANYQGPKTLAIESSAFSIASFIAMAFEDVEISSNGYMMLHNPYALAEGDDEELTKQAALLAQLKQSMVTAYAQRSGKTENEIRDLLKAETYLNAQQAVEMRLVSRVSGTPVVGRAFAKLSTMPHGVVAALFGAGSDGNTDSSKGLPSMSESSPVAATLQEIKAAFPKAKADFIVKCLERALPMASVATAAVEEMMAENEQLKAKLAAMEEEAKAAKAAAVPPEETEEEQEEEAKAPAAKAKGVTPVAKAKTPTGSARTTWAACLAKADAAGIPRAKAIATIEREHPGLRQQMLEEVNATRA